MHHIHSLVEHPTFKTFILWIILINAAVIGLETSQTAMNMAGGVLKAIDTLCLGIFVVEITLRLIAHKHKFFTKGWNIFDFTIVAISLVPATETLSILRALRVLRVLRVISVFPTLKRVVESLVRSLPGMMSVFALMGLIFYIGSVMATTLFGKNFPQWFGTIGDSAYTLFQIMTLESWSMGVVRPVMDIYPYAWAFFVPFILVTTFAVMNVVVGLIVNAIQEAHYDEEHERDDAHHAELLARIDALETLIKTHTKGP